MKRTGSMALWLLVVLTPISAWLLGACAENGNTPPPASAGAPSASGSAAPAEPPPKSGGGW